MTKLRKILFVCTGNICRSPAAEGILRAKAVDHGLSRHIFTDSAGTTPHHVGESPTNTSVLIAGRKGYDIAQLRARQVSADDFMSFDEIICMTKEHRATLENRFQVGGAKLRLFSDLVPPEKLPEEIPDPWSKPASAYEEMYAYLETGIDAYIRDLKSELKP